jgi:GTP-binding protein
LTASFFYHHPYFGRHDIIGKVCRKEQVWKANHENSRECFDEAVIYVKGGSGGHGSNTFKYGKGRQHVKPFGGSGGNGGSVWFKIDPNLNTLRKFRKNRSFHGENGLPGDKEYVSGLKGNDIEVTIPSGTIIYDNATSAKIVELSDASAVSQFKIASGGLGGKGNAAFKDKSGKTGCIPPEGGQKRWLKLELKLLADIGLIGVPNAGKSTLLKALTNADPKIADYAFTTLTPNLGICYIDEEDKDIREFTEKSMIIADIPGLIEGASQGIGLGKDFLKHIEKCKILIHVINGASLQDPVKEYLTINQELINYSELLAKKPQIVVLNKIDDLNVANKKEQLVEELKKVMSHTRFLVISAAAGIGIETLKLRTWNFFNKVKHEVS